LFISKSEPGIGDTQSNSGNLFDYLGTSGAIKQGDNGLSTVRLGGAENEQHDPIWNSVEPTGINFTEGEDPELSSGINTITFMGKTTFVPNDYFSYASVVPQDRFTAKRSWEGTKVKCLVDRRWVSLNRGGSPSEHQPNEEILDLNKLNVLASHDEDVTLAGNQAITFKIGDPKECALFAQGPPWHLGTTLDDIVWALESGAFDPVKLAKFLSLGECLFQGSHNKGIGEKHRLARRALATVFDTYDQFPSATVALKVIEMPLLKQQWVAASRGSRFVSEEEPDDSENDSDDSENDPDNSENDPDDSENDDASQHTDAVDHTKLKDFAGFRSLN